MKLPVYVFLGFTGFLLCLLVGTATYRLFEKQIEFKDAFHVVTSTVLRTGTVRELPKSNGGTWFLLLFSILVILYLSIVFVCIPQQPQNLQTGCRVSFEPR